MCIEFEDDGKGAEEDDADAVNLATGLNETRYYDGKLLQRICARLVGDEEESIQLTCFEILKILLDPNRMSNTKEEFLGIFYDHYIAWLTESLVQKGESSSNEGEKLVGLNSIPRGVRADSFSLLVGGIGSELNDLLTESGASSTTATAVENHDIIVDDPMEIDGRNDSSSGNTDASGSSIIEFDFAYAASHQSVVAKRSSQIQVIDLLCFAVDHHTYRIKYYVLRKNVVGMALNLLNYREKHVQLASIRFATTCLKRNEQFYNR